MPFEPPPKPLQLHHKKIDFYLDHIKEDNTFSMAGFSDAEFYCMMGIREGEETGLGQTLNEEHGKRLIDVLQRRQLDDDFLVAIPQCLWNLPHFADGQIDEFFHSRGIILRNAYERDQVTDNLARDAELFPLISLLRHRRCCIIGPTPLRKLRTYIGNHPIVEIDSPNLHMTEHGIETAIKAAKAYGHNSRDRTIYLVSAGVSAAVIIDQLHEVPGAWAIDCGSIWDAFVGIGAQRDWRRELYADPEKLEQWKRKNNNGE